MNDLQSMTGFASVSRRSGALSVTCDIRSVNNKGLDTRSRLPTGLEALEPQIRKLVAQSFSRGSIQDFLAIASTEGATEATVNEVLFRAYAVTGRRLAEECGIAPPTADGLLAIRAIVATDAAIRANRSDNMAPAAPMVPTSRVPTPLPRPYTLT